DPPRSAPVAFLPRSTSPRFSRSAPPLRFDICPALERNFRLGRRVLLRVPVLVHVFLKRVRAFAPAPGMLGFLGLLLPVFEPFFGKFGTANVACTLDLAMDGPRAGGAQLRDQPAGAVHPGVVAGFLLEPAVKGTEQVGAVDLGVGGWFEHG